MVFHAFFEILKLFFQVKNLDLNLFHLVFGHI